MVLVPITPDINTFPTKIQKFITGYPLYDSSCSNQASVIYIERDNGYFLKSAPRGSLAKETEMTRYFHSKQLAAEVIEYLTEESDWLLTVKIPGEDCTAARYLENPKRLCDTLAEWLFILHNTAYDGCPSKDHTCHYLAAAEGNYRAEKFDKNLFPDNWGYSTAEEAWSVVRTQGRFLNSDTLLHGDYCLPNIILNNWDFSGFVDVGDGGVGDRHVDLFWGIWTLFFNLKTDIYRDRFLDAYGRENVEEDKLRVIAAIEVFI